jgi:hypothetical protein
MENNNFGSKYLMIWADYENSSMRKVNFKTFISSPKLENEKYRTYEIVEGHSDMQQNTYTNTYEFKKLKKINDLYSYFTEDIVIQLKLESNIDILEFLDGFNETFVNTNTTEQQGILY